MPDFPCQLGDVLNLKTGESAWLGGVLVFSEERPVAALFVAPEATQDRVVYATPNPNAKLWWLEPLVGTAVVVGAQPPSALEIESVTYRRVRRLPCRASDHGSGVPELGAVLTLSEYASLGAERLVLVQSPQGAVVAYRGSELTEGTFEVVTPPG